MLASAAGSVTPGAVLDQNIWADEQGGVGTYRLAQVFTAGMTGQLTDVHVMLNSTPYAARPLLAASVTRTADGTPNPNQTLAKQYFVLPPSTNRLVEIHFSSPAFVQAGSKYALVIEDPKVTNFAFAWNYTVLTYSGGVAWFAPSQAPNFWRVEDALGPNTRFMLRTYVRPGSPAIDYWALGDSFSSGEGTYTYDGGSRNACHRGPFAWPRILQQRHAAQIPVITHRACTGAVTGNLVSQSGQLPSTPRPDIELVTFTIGGNDVTFSGIIFDCYATGCGGLPDSGFRAKLTTLWNTLVNTTYPALRAAFPNARIVHVGYPRITPPAGDRVVNCWWLKPDEQQAADRVLEELNHELASAAIASQLLGDDIEYLDVRNVFADHELCTHDSWMHPINLQLWQNRLTEQGHPNASGQSVWADAVAAGLGLG